MEIPARVQNGVVILEHGAVLPEGMLVTVLCDAVRTWRKPGEKKPVQFPLIHSNNPGTVDLTNERIAEILAAEDVASFQAAFGE